MMKHQSIPEHVPHHLVREFDLHKFELARTDCYQGWHDIVAQWPPVFYTMEHGGHWVINRASLLEEAWPDAERFSSADNALNIPYRGGDTPVLPNGVDDPLHRLVRHPLNMALSPAAVKALATEARELAISLIENFKSAGECEFVSDFSLMMPMKIFLNLVELPQSDRTYLLGLVHKVIRGGTVEERNAAHSEIQQYLEGTIRERTENPGDDLISKLINFKLEGRYLTHKEKLGYITNVLAGGLDTVGGTMSMIAKHLAEHPEDRKMLAANPEKIPDAIEEFFRRFSLPTIARIVARDIHFGGVDMKKGDRVILSTIVHGVDDRRWQDAMDVQLDRCPRRKNLHMAFGQGVHRCPGANIARAEIAIFLEEWLKRIPDFSIKPNAEVRFHTGQVVGLVSLPLVWPPAAEAAA